MDNFHPKRKTHAEAQRRKEKPKKNFATEFTEVLTTINAFLCAFAPLRESRFYIIYNYNNKL